MPAIYLKAPITHEERSALEQEFPNYFLLTSCETLAQWDEVEIVYGSLLSEEEFKQAHHLCWIHCTSSDTDGICMESILTRGNILISLSKGQNVPQMAEYALGAILAFAKQFFKIAQDPKPFFQLSEKENLWTLQDKILLQFGLGDVGTALVRLARNCGMKCWGVRRQRSFHPFCQKNFSFQHTHSLLPAADVCVITLSTRGRNDIVFKKAEFELMKSGSILIGIGAGDSIDIKDLEDIAQTGKFRGILLDLPQQNLPASSSSLWKTPSVILTPSLAHYPESPEHLAFQLFRKNLRLFIAGKFREMKNLIFS